MKNWLIILFTASLLLLMMPNTTAEYANIENTKDTDEIIENKTEISQLIVSSLSDLIDSERLEWDSDVNPKFKFIWNPNGSLLAVEANPGIRSKSLENSKEAFTAVYIMKGDGTELLKIASAENSVYTIENNNATIIFDSSWNHEGKRLIFGKKIGPLGGLSTEKIAGLYLYDLKENRIRSVIPQIKNQNSFALSPDGNSIAYDGVEESTQNVYVVDLVNQFEIKKIPVSGAELPIWISGRIWSPDGNKLLFIKYAGGAGSELWTVNKDGSNPAVISGQSGSYSSIKSPSWSPDGKKILFRENNNQQSGLYIADVDGSGKIQLTSGNEVLSGWNSDGSKIYYTSLYITREGEEHKLYTADADGSNTKLLAEEVKFSDAGLISGDRIAYLSGAGTSVLKRLKVVNLDGSGKVTLGNNVKKYIWNEAVGKIAYSAGMKDGRSVYLANPDGTEKNQITIHQYNDLMSWSPDGSRLIIASYSDEPWNKPEESGIYIVKLAGYDIAEFNEIDNIFTKNPDGKKEPITEVTTSKPVSSESTPQTPGFTGVLTTIIITVLIFYKFKDRRMS